MEMWPWLVFICATLFTPTNGASPDLEIVRGAKRNEEDVSDVRIGDQVALHCVLKYRTRNEAFVVAMEWEVPSKCDASSYKIIQPEHTHSSQFNSTTEINAKDIGRFEVEIYTSTIMIRDVSKQHEGHYFCRLKLKISETYVDAYASTYENYFLDVVSDEDAILDIAVQKPTSSNDTTVWIGQFNPDVVIGFVWIIAGMPNCILGTGGSLDEYCNSFCPFDSMSPSDFYLNKYDNGSFELKVSHRHECDSPYEIILMSALINKTVPLEFPTRSTRKFSRAKQIITNPGEPKFNETFNVTCYLMTINNFHLGLVFESDKYDYICDERNVFPTFGVNSFPTLFIRRLAVLTVPMRLMSSGKLFCGSGSTASKKNYSSRYLCFSKENNFTTSGTLEVPENEKLRLTCRAPYCTEKGRTRLGWKSDVMDDSFEVSKTKCASYIESNLTRVNVSGNAAGSYTCQQWQVPESTTRKGSIAHANIINKTLSVTILPPLPDPNSARSTSTISSISVLGVLIIVLSSVAVFYYIQSKKRQNTLRRLLNGAKGSTIPISPDQSIHDQIDNLPFDSKWEFPRKLLTLGQQLGAGYFGVVHKAEARGITHGEETTTVAVKMAKRYGSEAVTISLIKELKVMSHLGSHCNVVNLLGAVTDKLDHLELMIIVEFCPYGNLLAYMTANKHRFMPDDYCIVKGSVPISKGPNDYRNLVIDDPDRSCDEVMPFNENVLLGWSYQISRGMEWLESRKVLHGDLAARNILLCSGNIVKISDFGLACNLTNYVYEKDEDVKLPFRWLAIECLENRIFSTQSDVWAFGITLWEIYTLGQIPYFAFDSFSDVWKRLCSGYRLEKPAQAPMVIYDIMKQCWHVQPSERPPFRVISENLSALLEDSVRSDYLAIEDDSRRVNPIADDDVFMMCKAPNFNDYQNVQRWQPSSGVPFETAL